MRSCNLAHNSQLRARSLKSAIRPHIDRRAGLMKKCGAHAVGLRTLGCPDRAG